MPRVKKTKRTTSRKRKSTKKSSAIRRFARKTPLTGVSKFHYARLRYVEEMTLDAAAGGVSSVAYKANGLYDPRVAAGGHQPMGFDQMMAYYNRFIVLGSKITVRYTPVATTNLNMAYAGVLLSNNQADAQGFTNIYEILESKNTGKPALFGGYFDSQNKGRAVCKRTFSLKKWIASRAGSEDVYSGTDSADPTNTVYYEIYCASVGANDPGNMYFVITIDYFVKFYEPKNIAGS